MIEIKKLIKDKDYEGIKNFHIKDIPTNKFIIQTILNKITNETPFALALLDIANLDLSYDKTQKNGSLKNIMQEKIAGKAILRDKIEILEKLKEKNYDFSFSHVIGYNFLTLAIFNNKEKSINFLIEKYPELITQQEVNGNNNIINMLQENISTDLCVKAINKCSFDFSYKTKYNHNLCDSAINEYSSFSLNKIIELYPKEKLKDSLSEDNFKTLWDVLLQDLNKDSFIKIIDTLKENFNLNDIQHPYCNLNLLDFCLIFTSHENFQYINTKDLHTNINLKKTTQVMSEDYISYLYEFSKFEDFEYYKYKILKKTENLDNNLFSIIKKTKNFDILQNINIFEYQLMTTGIYLLNNTDYFKNKNNIFFIQSVFKKNRIFSMPHQHVLHFLESLDEKQKLSAKNITSVLHKLDASYYYADFFYKEKNKTITQLLQTINSKYINRIVKNKNNLAFFLNINNKTNKDINLLNSICLKIIKKSKITAEDFIKYIEISEDLVINTNEDTIRKCLDELLLTPEVFFSKTNIQSKFTNPKNKYWIKQVKILTMKYEKDKILKEIEGVKNEGSKNRNRL